MRKIRRKDREIKLTEAMALLSQCEYGVLSTADQDGQPYGVPLNYAYKDNAIYFHCARAGHKIDNIAINPRVSFCVVGRTNILQAKFSTEYESAVAFGAASTVQGTERINALQWLVEKYSPDFIEEGKKYIEETNSATTVIKIKIDHISGKARR